jgi:superfamily II DNA or RNA helicase
MIAKTTKKRLHVELTNRYAIFRCSPERKKKIKKYFRFIKPGSEWSPSFQDGSWDGYTNMMQYGRVATGLFLAKLGKIEKRYAVTIEDKREAPLFLDKPLKTENENFEGRKYQSECHAAMIKASNSGGIVLIATSGGKTYLTANYFASLVGSALFVVDELTLFLQSKNEFELVLGEEVGVVGGGKFSPQRVTVATIQTLHRQKENPEFQKWFRTLEVVIIDEIHVMINRRNIDVLSSIRPKAIFGLTATLELSKETVWWEATALCGPVVFEYSIQQGTEEGYITKGRVACVCYRDRLRKPVTGYFTSIKNKKVWIPASSPTAEYRFHICLNKERNDVIESLAREGVRRGLPTIILVQQRIHLKTLSKRLEDIKHHAICGDKSISGDSASRIKAMKDMDAGRVLLLIATNVFGKGVNIKKLEVIIDGTGLPNRNRAIQRYGRGVRQSEGKTLLRYIDISDRCNAFSHAAFARASAFAEIDAEIIELDWHNNPGKVFTKLEDVNE